MTALKRVGDNMEQSASTRRILSHHISYGAFERAPWCQQMAPRKPRAWETDYSRFQRIQQSEPVRKDRTCVRRLCDRLYVLRKNHSTAPNLLWRARWKVSVFVVLFLACIYFRLKVVGDSFYSESQWIWDNNVYKPRQSGNSSQVVAVEQQASPKNLRRNLLLAQFSGSPALDAMSSISSRPNRAYARQWVRDYVRCTGSSSKRLDRACFDKVFVLSTILSHQVHSESLWSSSSRVQYDAVVLLPPDAIITDLDSDLLNLFPADKLVAVASYEHVSSIYDSALSEVLFFNLRHKYAAKVVELWNSLSEPPVTCGAGNDIRLLLDAVGSVAESEKERDDLISQLVMSDNGFMGSRAIKEVPEKVPTSKAVMLVSNAGEIKAELQTTAASVCYRYYPRCDVL